MGAYSTVLITRQRAISHIIELLDEATDEEIGDALFALTQNHRMDNYGVVAELPPKNNDMFDIPTFLGPTYRDGKAIGD